MGSKIISSYKLLSLGMEAELLHYRLEDISTKTFKTCFINISIRFRGRRKKRKYHFLFGRL